MATNPFASVGLGSFGNDAREAQYGAYSQMATNKAETERKLAAGGERGIIPQFVGTLIPGSAQYFPKKPTNQPNSTVAAIPPADQTNVRSINPVAPGFAMTPPIPGVAMTPPISGVDNQNDAHPELKKRLFESILDWGL